MYLCMNKKWFLSAVTWTGTFATKAEAMSSGQEGDFLYRIIDGRPAGKPAFRLTNGRWQKVVR